MSSSLGHPHSSMDCSTHACLSFTVSRSLLKLMSIQSVLPPNHLIPCCPLSSCPQSFSASIIWRAVLSMVQLSHPCMTTGNIIALTKETSVSKVMFLLLNILSGIVIAFLSKSKHLLISGLQSPYAVILEDEENNVCHCFHYFPIYLPWSDGTRCHDLSFLNLEF